MKKNSKTIDPNFNRRQVLKAGLISSASLLIPWFSRINFAFAGESPILEHFVDPLPKPAFFQPDPTRSAGTVKYFNVQMAQVKQKLHRDLPETTVWGYGDENGKASFPGPTFEAYDGDNIVVNWINNLAKNPDAPHYLDIDPWALDHTDGGGIHGAENSRKTVVHLHGGHIPAAVDGDPYEKIYPGQSLEYDYPINQQAATLWYHDHSLGNTRLNVYMGLAGFFLVRDQNEEDMISNGYLPASAYEFPLVLQDRQVKANGKLGYDTKFDDMFLGDVLLVNGIIWPFLTVERRQYRFRVLNGSNSRAYTLQLPGGKSFYQIGTDGGFLNSPVELYELTLTPGERADIVINFAQFGRNENVVLANTAPPLLGHPGEEKEKDINDIMQFRVRGGTVQNDIILPMTDLYPYSDSPVMEILPEDAAVVRDFKLEDFPDAQLGSKWLINGKGYDEITEKIKPGAVEIWNFINKSSHLHPMHLHLVQFQVLSRHKKVEDGYDDIGVDDNEMGWKDTVRVAGKEIVSVIAKFPDDRSLDGNYPYHCHILEHEDHEMMRQFSLG
jgi:spore coat protein A